MTEEYAGRKFKTRFVEKKVLDYPEVKELLEAAAKLRRHGLLHGIPGNLSVRHGKNFLITAGGVDKAVLSKRHIVEVLGYDRKAGIVTASGIEEPSSEARMHYMIYRNFPKVNAVVHVHDETVLANLEKARSCGAAVTEKEFPYGTQELALEVVKSLEKSDYAVMLNHGSVSAASSLGKAVDAAINFHRAASGERRNRAYGSEPPSWHPREPERQARTGRDPL
jgi:L-fuculose-phosphate aldolase